MSYRDAVEFLYGLQMFGSRFGLENPSRLAELAGNPQQRLRFIHVAGTNGKGSTCAMLEAIYRASGLRVGLYTSPHLVTFRERIQVNRQCISEEDVARLVNDARRWLKEFDEQNHPTFFEVTTVLALRHFCEAQCELVILETGLGGRLDATNIVTPLASVITNVHFDHEQWLGNTLEQIAQEKAGIIKPRVPVITAANEPQALEVLRKTAERLHAPFHLISPGIEDDSAARTPRVALPGAHQRINAALAQKTAEVLKGILPVSPQKIAEALANVQWPARFQIMARPGQTLILDGAHNPAGARALIDAFRAEFPGRSVSLIIGMLQDKNFDQFCRTVAPLAARIVTVPVASRRTCAAENLAEVCRAANPSAEVRAAGSLPEALAMVAAESLVMITGSLYLAGEALEILEAVPPGERALNEWTAPVR